MAGNVTGPASKFDKAVVMEIVCTRLAAGESLREVCRTEGMPTPQLIYHWVANDTEIAARYDRARMQQCAHWADELVDIADNSVNDFVKRAAADGSVEVIADREHINRSRLRVDTRKWILSKLIPKQYGERQTLEHTGAGGGAIQISSMDQEQMKVFILSVTHDCPACRIKAAAKLLELESGGVIEGEVLSVEDDDEL